LTSHAKTPLKANTMKGLSTYNLQEAGADVRVGLCMTNTTMDTEEDIEFVGSVTTLDEMDGANYVRKQCESQTVTADTTNNRGEFDFADITWTNLGAGTRQVAGFFIYIYVTNDADSPVLAWVDSGGFPFSANGGNFTIQVNAEGAIQHT